MNKQQLNLLINLKNFSCLGKETLTINYSLKTIQLILFLYKEGLIQSFFLLNDKITINIRFFNGKNSLSNLKIISKSSYKKFLNYKNICRLNFNKQIVAVSTDKGFLNMNTCKKQTLGGKIIFIC